MGFSEKMPLLLAQNLHKKFAHPIEIHLLRGVDLQVHSGEAVAVTGRSGEGKSTLLNLLGMLETPSQGELQIVSQPVTVWNKRRLRNRHVAFIFQAFHLLEDYSVLDNVLMPARIARMKVHKNSSAYQRAWELLALVGMENRAHFSTRLLSGGEKQRVAIARALCNDPELILADEPSGNLDRVTADGIHKLLIDLAHEQKKGVLIVTHNQDLASLCDRQLVLEAGVLEPV